MSHVDEGRLHAWLDRDRSDMTPAEAAEIESHLAGCEACGALLLQAQSYRDGAAAVLAEVGVTRAEWPDFESRLGGVTRRRSTDGRGRRSFAVLWAASFALAVGLGWFGRDLVRQDRIAIQGEFGAATVRSAERRIGDQGGQRTSEPEYRGDTAERPVMSDPAPTTPAPPVADAATLPAPLVEARSPRAEDRSNTAAMSPDDDPVAGLRSPPTSAPGPAVDGVQSRIANASPPTDTASAVSSAGSSSGPFSDRARQTRTLAVRGRVVDSSGRPIGSTQVTIPETGVGTITRNDGSFFLPLEVLDAPPEAVTVLAQRIGFESRSVVVPEFAGDTAAMEIALREAVLSLDEIITTGTAATPDTSPMPVAPSIAEVAGSIDDTPAPGAVAPAEWRRVTRAAAEALLQRPLVSVPELPVLGVETLVGVDAVVRVLQETGSGRAFTVTIARAEGRQIPSVDASFASEIRGDFLVTISGPLTPEDLRELLARAR